ncbi:MAG: transcriptional regulator [Deferribacteraceae bacterium]|jgi:predicted DNA-binding transcriptional regulator YafY|nr:transcriptional regulator [Deferribacteraceae bacterium]
MADINLNVALRLLKVLNSHKQINYKTIMDEFKVSRKTAYRYLEKIEEHFPVYTPSEKVKSFRLMSDYRVDNNSSGVELAFLASLLDFAKGVMPEGQRKELEVFKQKIFASSRLSTHLVLNDYSVDYNVVAETVLTLEKYILANEIIRFVYSRKEKSYTVKPYKILYYEGAWYLLAEHDGIFKTFLLDAIEKIRSGGGFFKPDYTSMEKYASETKNIWQIQNNKIETVTVHINKAVADNFKRRSIFPHQQLIKIEKNGGMALTFGVTTDMEFKQLIMPWFPEFKIIKPVRYKKLVDDMIKQYMEFKDC